MQSHGGKLVRRKSILCIPMGLGILFFSQRGEKLLEVNGYSKSKGILMALLKDTKLEWWPKDTHSILEWTMVRCLHPLLEWPLSEPSLHCLPSKTTNSIP